MIYYGSFPPGLTLNSATGAITGKPTVSGTFNFSIMAIGENCSPSRACSIIIACPLSVTTPLITGTNSFCAGSSTVLKVANAIPNIIYLWSNGMTGDSITVAEAGCYSVQAISCVSNVSSSSVNVTLRDSTSCGSARMANPSVNLVKNEVTLFPNPSTGVVNLQLTGAEKATYEVYSVLGERIATGTVTNEAATLDMNNHPAGMYLVKVRTGNEVITKQLVINR
jgi:hypothetical protein